MGTYAARNARQKAGAQAGAARIAASSAAARVRKGVREAARLASYATPTDVLSAADAGASATISIANHSRVYPVQGDVAVPSVAIAGAAPITGLAFATKYFVYYDDVTLSLTAPAMIATTDDVDASPGVAPGRHFVGTITTPADGAGGTTGTGGTPGGWDGGEKFSRSYL